MTFLEPYIENGYSVIVGGEQTKKLVLKNHPTANVFVFNEDAIHGVKFVVDKYVKESKSVKEALCQAEYCYVTYENFTKQFITGEPITLIENVKNKEIVMYEEISRLEAMSIIDSGKIGNLYFVGIYRVRGNRSYWQPRDTKQTEPIKYLSQIIVESNRVFKKYEKVKATPNNYIKETENVEKDTHKWLLKVEEIDLRMKPPIDKLNKSYRDLKREIRDEHRKLC